MPHRIVTQAQNIATQAHPNDTQAQDIATQAQNNATKASLKPPDLSSYRCPGTKLGVIFKCSTTRATSIAIQHLGTWAHRLQFVLI